MVDGFPIVETVDERKRRRGGYPVLMTIDAAAFAASWEARTGEKLAWNPRRTEMLKTYATVNGHPLVCVNELGQPEITDGRHRIALAASLGQTITVAVPRGTKL